MTLALAMWAAAASAQTLADLSPPQARQLAAQAVVSGDAGLAREIALSLLAADPDDRTALIVLAAAERQLGRPAEARQAAQRAWGLSETRAQRYQAARLAARAAAEERRFLLAEGWLRLALASAPDEEQETRTLADARIIRAQSPWRVEVELGFSPSDNVNGGSETPFTVIDGLPVVFETSVDGQALSGWVGTAELQFTRRLSESRTHRTELSFRLWGRGVALSDEAEALIEEEQDEGDPEITGSDFTSVLGEVRLGHRRAVDWGLVGGDLTLGRSRAADDPLVTYLRLSGLAAWELGERHTLSATVSAEERRSDEDRIPDEQSFGAELAWGLRVRDDDRLTLAVSRSVTRSDNRNQASDGWGVRASYALGEQVGPARLSFMLGASRTEYPDYALLFPVPGGRNDDRVFARIEATFDDWSFAGFAPVISLDAARSDSNVSRFDTESVGIGFSFRSTF